MVEIDNIVNEETEVETNPVSNDGVEPEVKQTIEKKKKPRSPAQIAAFEKAIAKRKSNLEAKKKVKIEEKKPEIKEEVKEMVKIEKTSTNENAFPSTQTGFNPLDVDLKAWMEQEEPEPEPEVEDDEDDEDYADDEEEEEEESEEEEIIVKKKPKKVKSKPIPIPKKKPIEKKKKQKIVYVSDSEDDEPEPAKDPLEGMSWRDRSRLRGF